MRGDVPSAQPLVDDHLLERLEAHWAVPAAKSFRPEHRSALHWLNQLSGEGSGFFGVEVHAVRIGAYLDPVDPADREGWPQYRAWAIETLGELRRVFAEPIKNLP